MSELCHEVHRVGSDQVQLLVRQTGSSDEFLALVEGGGMCLAHSLTSRTAAADWLHQVLEALFPKHRCGPGCEVVSGSQSLAEEGLRNLLASVQESPAR